MSGDLLPSTSSLREAVNAVTIEQVAEKLFSHDLTPLHLGYQTYCPSCQPSGSSGGAEKQLLINTGNDTYHCLDCGTSGNPLTLISEAKKLKEFEALYYLVALVDGVDPPLVESQKSRAYEMLHFAQTFYTKQFWNSDVAKEYMKHRRGYSEETLCIFRIGYALPRHFNQLYHALLRKGFTRQETIDFGLTVDKSPETYDRFQSRILFPLESKFGRILGFGGRFIDAQGDGSLKDSMGNTLHIPKYLNSPDSSLFRKSEQLFGYPQMKNSLTKHGRFVLAEGYTDVMSMYEAKMHEHGYPTLASMGVGISAGFIDFLKRFADEAIIFRDADKAGVQAALRDIPSLIGAGIDVRVILAEEGQDPDSVVMGTSDPLDAFSSLQQYDIVNFLIRSYEFLHKRKKNTFSFDDKHNLGIQLLDILRYERKPSKTLLALDQMEAELHAPKRSFTRMYEEYLHQLEKKKQPPTLSFRTPGFIRENNSLPAQEQRTYVYPLDFRLLTQYVFSSETEAQRIEKRFLNSPNSVSSENEKLFNLLKDIKDDPDSPISFPVEKEGLFPTVDKLIEYIGQAVDEKKLDEFPMTFISMLKSGSNGAYNHALSYYEEGLKWQRIKEFFNNAFELQQAGESVDIAAILREKGLPLYEQDKM